MHRDLRRPPRHRIVVPTLGPGVPARRVAPGARLVRPASRRLPAEWPTPAPTRQSPPNGFDPDPFVDYGRWLTAEGGILIAWKDLDTRLRHTVWRVVAWGSATTGDGWLLRQFAAPHGPWFMAAGLLIMALVNVWIVAKPIHRHRTVEIRPDGLILDGQDIFWLRHMAAGWPAFQADKEGHQCLRGSYGTRFVEFLTVRRFDELDRTPEVFAAQLQDAMQQLWTRLI